jgi:signal transduction histidine kinase
MFFDEHRVIVSVEAALCRAFGCGEESFLGRCLDDVPSRRDHTGSRAYVEKLASGETLDLVLHINIDGREHTARLVADLPAGEATLERVDDEGSLGELVQLRRQWRAVVRDTADAVVIVDDRGAIVDQNGRLVEMLGLRTSHGIALGADSLSGQHFFDVIEREGFGVEARVAFAAPKPRDRALTRRVAVGQRSFHLVMAPILTGTREFVGCSVVLSDVTAEEELTALRATTAHQAGMARVATGVLHNVGNVLNSINVSSEVLLSRVAESKLVGLDRLAELVRDRPALSPETIDRAFEYVTRLAERRAAEHDELMRELRSLKETVAHAKAVVATQQSLAKAPMHVEDCDVGALLAFAATVALGPNQPELFTTCSVRGRVGVARHSVLQILVNLLKNAREACAERQDGEVCLRAFTEPDLLVVEVEDNGVGCAPADVPKIFSGGYTTKSTGHGFGLHESATSAAELGGSLRVVRTSVGEGVTFRLELPLIMGDTP